MRAAVAAALVDTGGVATADLWGVDDEVVAFADGVGAVDGDCDASVDFFATVCDDVFFNSGNAEAAACVHRGGWAVVYKLRARLVRA